MPEILLESSLLRVNVGKNRRLLKKSRTRSKINLAYFLSVGSLIFLTKQNGVRFLKYSA